MSLRPIVARPVNPLFKIGLCIFCQSRSLLQPFRRHATHTASSSLSRSKQQQKSPLGARDYGTGGWVSKEQQARLAVDQNARIQFFSRCFQGGRIQLDATNADELVTELWSSRTKVDPVSNVLLAAETYKINLADITQLALATGRIVDSQKSNLRISPSIHNPMSDFIMLSCSKAMDPTAVLHIMGAVYLSNNNTTPTAKTIANRMSRSELKDCEEALRQLAIKGNTGALTLQGQFLERKGQVEQARALYEKALEKCDTKHELDEWETPRLAPWNALGFLTMDNKDQKAQAKAAFEKGALEADDPVSYFHLASFEDPMSANWLKYMTKAAASGDLEAMFRLACFYTKMAAEKDSVPRYGRVATMVAWLTLKGEARYFRHAQEWFMIAAYSGHKPSMLELAEMSFVYGDQEKAKRYLRDMLAPPLDGGKEEWPRLVEEARKRLLT
ncbi:hypothetical protein BDV95DRAFT_603829 [Massariosphaeria phaeospora]|uniref:Uncharacterized protein n=1 Tax=Massariosphaeria phaeospora TaxID=100035 RepID=A0A7C8MCT1_9PLEO|nr:hypothetical protein BDV95DRAFT_603829 [Massariosphaeria phaeospora]